MWLSAKDHLRFAIVPWSTRGGTSVSGFSASREGFVGPMIVAPSLPLIGRGRLENSICSPSCVLEKAIEHLLLLRILSSTKAFRAPNESACYDLSEDILKQTSKAGAMSTSQLEATKRALFCGPWRHHQDITVDI